MSIMDSIVKAIGNGAFTNPAYKQTPLAVCPKCKEVCEVEDVDDRFTHEFGISGFHGPVSNCCGVLIRPSDLLE